MQPVEPEVGLREAQAGPARRAGHVRRRAHHVANDLADAVPGQRLIEVDLTRELQISRGPVREAFKQLAGQGVLVLNRHRGGYIRARQGRSQLHARCDGSTRGARGQAGCAIHSNVPAPRATQERGAQYGPLSAQAPHTPLISTTVWSGLKPRSSAISDSIVSIPLDSTSSTRPHEEHSRNWLS